MDVVRYVLYIRTVSSLFCHNTLFIFDAADRGVKEGVQRFRGFGETGRVVGGGGISTKVPLGREERPSRD